MTFFAEIGIVCKSTAGPLSKAKTHWIFNCFNSWTNWILYGVIPRSLCKIRLNDVAEMFNYWERWNPPRSKWASSKTMIFFLPKSASFVNRSQDHLAKRKRIGWSIGFKSWTNWTLYGVMPRSLCKIHLNDVSEMFNCWERRKIDVDGASYTLSVTAAIFSGVRTVFGFSRVGLSMRMPVTFIFFTR